MGCVPAFPYDDTIFQWMAQGRLEFDRSSFRAVCAREGLLGPTEGGRRVYGVKSFEHAFDRLEERCHEVLDLVPAFDERFIRNDQDWQETLYPDLRRFLLGAAQNGPWLRLALDAHATLAFAAGSVLNIKSGRQIELEQRTTNRRVWKADDQPTDPTWPTLAPTTIETHSDQPDMAVALGVTHDIGTDVRRYTDAKLPSVGRLLVLRPSNGAGAQSVVCGRHAWELADAAVSAVREARSLGTGLIHLFIAAPNALTFFLGQRQPLLGQVQLYEFDFEGGRDRSYAPALRLPMSEQKAMGGAHGANGI